MQQHGVLHRCAARISNSVSDTLCAWLIACLFLVAGILNSTAAWSANEKPWKIARLDHGEGVAQVAWSPDDRFVAAIGHNGSSVSIWNWQENRLVHQRRNIHVGVQFEDIEFTPDGRSLITTALPPERRWNLRYLSQARRERELAKSGYELHALSVYDLNRNTWASINGPFEGRQLAFNNCRSVVVVSSTDAICDFSFQANALGIFNLATLTFGRPVPVGNVLSMVLVPGTRTLIADIAHVGIVRVPVDDASSFHTIATDLIQIPLALDVSSDGRSLAIVSSREHGKPMGNHLNIEIRDTDAGKTLHKVNDHSNESLSAQAKLAIKISKNAEFLAWQSRRSAVFVSLSEPSATYEIAPSPRQSITSMQFSHSSRYLAVADGPRVVIVDVQSRLKAGRGER